MSEKSHALAASTLDRVTGDRGPAVQFVTFKIGAEEYGVDIMRVREIKGWSVPTRLPNAPIHVRGVINLRGTMVPIFDLRARFGMGETQATDLHVVIIVAVGDRVIGILVDAVSDIVTVEPGEIQPVPDTDRSVEADFLGGLVTIEGRMVALLTIDRMFAFDRLEPKANQLPELVN